MADQPRQRDAQADHRGQPGGYHRAPAQPDGPASPQDGVHRRTRRVNGAQRRVEAAPDLPLAIGAHGFIPSARPLVSRNLASAREAWLFTLPTEQPSVAATSVSLMSIQ